MQYDPRSNGTTQEGAAKAANAVWAVARDRAALGLASWLDLPVNPATTSERDVERIVAVLAELAERLHNVEMLADYAADKAEAV